MTRRFATMSKDSPARATARRAASPSASARASRQRSWIASCAGRTRGRVSRRVGRSQTCVASSRSAATRRYAHNPCRGPCAAPGCPGREPGPFARGVMPRPQRRSPMRAFRCFERRGRGAPRQAREPLVNGRSPVWVKKGRTGHRWWIKGQSPPGRADRRLTSIYLFAAVQPATGAVVCLVLPRVSTTATSVFLAAFAAMPADLSWIRATDTVRAISPGPRASCSCCCCHTVPS